MQSVIATSLAVISVISLTSVGASFYAGHLDFKLALPFAAGSMAGMGVASLLRQHLSQKYLKKSFGVLCFVVAIVMILKVWQNIT